MEIVIDIPDELVNDTSIVAVDVNYIKNGQVLPKGHGDLIDRDKLLDELDTVVHSVDDTNKYLLFWDRAVAFVHLAPTVIEADKENNNDL